MFQWDSGDAAATVHVGETKHGICGDITARIMDRCDDFIHNFVVGPKGEYYSVVVKVSLHKLSKEQLAEIREG